MGDQIRAKQNKYYTTPKRVKRQGNTGSCVEVKAGRPSPVYSL